MKTVFGLIPTGRDADTISGFFEVYSFDRDTGIADLRAVFCDAARGICGAVLGCTFEHDTTQDRIKAVLDMYRMGTYETLTQQEFDSACNFD